MSQELHYTSVPRGLKPGTRGFCTVAMTPQLTGPLIERLENLSGYQPVYPPHDPSAPLNPVNFAHVRFSLGGRPLSILSRVGPSGLDYSGRTNKYAHHVVIDAAERPEGGPAWLLARPGFMQAAWDGEPRMLDAGRPVPHGDRPAGMATAWASLTGDAGWAGVLAEAFLADPRRPAFVVFRPGMDLLPLFVEAIALLPVSKRWDVEFGTYLTQAPRGINYAWRGVLEGSPEAAGARRLPGALIIDLCGAPKRAEGGPLVHTARTGESREWQGSSAARPIASPVSRHPAAPAEPTIPMAGPPPQAPTAQENYELIPELAARFATGRNTSHEQASSPRRGRRRIALLVVGIMVACLIPLAVGAYFMRGSAARLLGLNPDVMQKVADNQKTVKEKKRILEREEEKKTPERKAEMVANAETTTPKVETVVPEPLGDKAGAAVAPKPDNSPRPADKPASRPAPRAVTVARPSTNVKPLFCELEEPVSGLGGKVDQKPIKPADPDFEIENMELIGDNGFKQTPERDPDGRRLLISSSLPDRQDGRPLASFRLSDSREITFKWAEGMNPGEERKDERERLRSCVLKLTSKKKSNIFCILQSRPADPAISEDLTDKVEFEGRSNCRAVFYKWGIQKYYNRKLADLKIDDCVILKRGSDMPFSTDKAGRDLRILAPNGDPLLSIELGRLIPPPPNYRLDTKLTSDSALAVAPNSCAVIVIKLFDPEPEKLEQRIDDLKNQIDDVEDDKEANNYATQIAKAASLRLKLSRLKMLKEIKDSSLELGIAMEVGDAKLEIAHLKTRKHDLRATVDKRKGQQ